MKILVVDDGQLAINSLIRILCRVAPDCDYISAMTTDDALTWMRQGPMDAAFLNLEMPGMNGLALAAYDPEAATRAATSSWSPSTRSMRWKRCRSS